MPLDSMITPRLSPAEKLMIQQQEQQLLDRMFRSGPQTLGRYVLREKIGEGGMGIVYAAYDTKLRRKVALKLLTVDHPDLRRRLVREARAMARLSHPNTVEIHEVGEFHDQAFIAMEYIDGVTLREWLSAKSRTIPEILTVFLAAGRGLAAAHARGLVHRDFKPANVMIDATGRARVMDFGVARIQTTDDDREDFVKSNDSILTHPGTLIGTPCYMSPEQACCEPTDARSDQFSFCVALYEALYASRPFASVGGAIPCFVDLEQTTPRPGARPANLTRGLERVVFHGLRLDPAQRYASMTELLTKIEQCIGLQEPAGRRTTSRRSWAAATVVGLAVIGAALFAGFEIHHTRATARVYQDAHVRRELQQLRQRLASVQEDVVKGGYPAPSLLFFDERDEDGRPSRLPAVDELARASLVGWMVHGLTPEPFRVDLEGWDYWVEFRMVEMTGQSPIWLAVAMPMEPLG